MEDYGNEGLSWQKDSSWGSYCVTTLHTYETVILENDSHGTGYAVHRDDIVLAGKTGTAEIKASKDDTSGTELGWFAIYSTEETVEHPILIISMVGWI